MLHRGPQQVPADAAVAPMSIRHSTHESPRPLPSRPRLAVGVEAAGGPRARGTTGVCSAGGRRAPLGQNGGAAADRSTAVSLASQRASSAVRAVTRASHRDSRESVIIRVMRTWREPAR